MLYKLLYNLGFPHSSVRKESTCNAGDPGLIPELGRSASWEGIGYLLQCSGLENSTDCMAHAVTKSRTQLRDFTFTYCLTLTQNRT